MENSIVQINLNIQGMTCVNCSNRIEKKLMKTIGILNAKVDLASESAFIIYDQTKIKESKILEIINELGYKAISNKNITNFDENQIKELSKQKNKFIISLILTIPITLISMNWVPLPNNFYYSVLIHLLILIFTTIVLFYCGNQFILGFFKSIKNLYPDMTTLVTIGSLSAYLLSTYELLSFYLNMRRELPHLYFDTTATIISFILLGKFLERKTLTSTTSSIKSLLQMQKNEVTIVRDQKEIIIRAEYIKPGDIIILRPGDSVPIDGVIIDGNASIDESIISGESLPTDKKIGDIITSGSVLKYGYLKVKAEKTGEDTYISKIIELIKKTQSTKPPIQKFADKIASIFVPIILIISSITFLFWFFNTNNIYYALMRAISVLIISCPCALGLATPTAIITAIGLSAKNNIFFRDVQILEKVKKVNAIVFDKTGTITDGILKIIDIKSFSNYSETEILKIAASGEYFSEHPVARTLYNEYKKTNKQLIDIKDFTSLSGYGIKFSYDSNKVVIGNIDLVKNSLNYTRLKDQIQSDHNTGNLNIYISVNNNIIGRISFSDTIKNDAREIIQKIKELNIRTYLVSGDNEQRTKNTANKIQVDYYYSEIKPDKKLEIISELQSNGMIVAMVGDGINDAPALAKADISMAYSSGTDIAMSTSSITLTKNDLKSVYNSIIISNKTMRIIKQNLFWAFFYNIICIPIAAGIISSIHLNPSIAAFAMAFSSVSVVCNSLRIKKIKLYGKYK